VVVVVRGVGTEVLGRVDSFGFEGSDKAILDVGDRSCAVTGMLDVAVVAEGSVDPCTGAGKSLFLVGSSMGVMGGDVILDGGDTPMLGAIVTPGVATGEVSVGGGVTVGEGVVEVGDTSVLDGRGKVGAITVEKGSAGVRFDPVCATYWRVWIPRLRPGAKEAFGGVCMGMGVGLALGGSMGVEGGGVGVGLEMGLGVGKEVGVGVRVGMGIGLGMWMGLGVGVRVLVGVGIIMGCGIVVAGGGNGISDFSNNMFFVVVSGGKICADSTWEVVDCVSVDSKSVSCITGLSLGAGSWLEPCNGAESCESKGGELGVVLMLFSKGRESVEALTECIDGSGVCITWFGDDSKFGGFSIKDERSGVGGTLEFSEFISLTDSESLPASGNTGLVVGTASWDNWVMDRSTVIIGAGDMTGGVRIGVGLGKGITNGGGDGLAPCVCDLFLNPPPRGANEDVDSGGGPIPMGGGCTPPKDSDGMGPDGVASGGDPDFSGAGLWVRIVCPGVRSTGGGIEVGMVVGSVGPTGVRFGVTGRASTGTGRRGELEAGEDSKGDPDTDPLLWVDRLAVI
jgi:hypothetical protein